MAWFDNTKTHEPYNNNFLLFCIFLSSIKMINLYIFILIFVAKCFYFFYYWRWYPYFITVYYFLATEKFSSLIFVSKNTFCGRTPVLTVYEINKKSGYLGLKNRFSSRFLVFTVRPPGPVRFWKPWTPSPSQHLILLLSLLH